MTRRRRRQVDPLSLWVDAVAAGVATAVTLSVRVPQLWTGTMSRAEAARMFGEKAAAAGEGFVAGSAAAARAAARQLSRPSPHGAAVDALEVADALTRPARRRAKANAERLSKR